MENKIGRMAWLVATMIGLGLGSARAAYEVRGYQNCIDTFVTAHRVDNDRFATCYPSSDIAYDLWTPISAADWASAFGPRAPEVDVKYMESDYDTCLRLHVYVGNSEGFLSCVGYAHGQYIPSYASAVHPLANETIIGVHKSAGLAAAASWFLSGLALIGSAFFGIRL